MSKTEGKRTEVSSLGEFGLIEKLTSSFQVNNKSTIKAIGDDAAVISYGDVHSVVSTDMLVEGIHFDLIYTPLKHLGYKAIAVNVSDICAMNAKPAQVTFSMAISNRFSVEALEEIYAGIKLACDAYNVDLIGGDTTSSNKGLILSVTAIGEAKADELVYRNGAKEGDIICVSGNLGAAYLGLQLLEREKQLYLSDPSIQPELNEQAYLVGRQLRPEARIDMLQHFRDADFVPTAMIDISDGLSSDLLHICRQSGVGARIEEENIPVHPEAQMQAINFKLDPTSCALSGGEDYELLFTAKPEDLDKLRFMPDIFIMGEVKNSSEGIKLISTGGKEHDLEATGWTHFEKHQ